MTAPNETAQIIDFKSWTKTPSASASAKTSRVPASLPRREILRQERSHQLDGNLSETYKNKRLRDRRLTSWRRADALVNYWRARLGMEGAISRAQSHGLPEGDAHPPYNPDDRWTILGKWRIALMQQLLTPAPDKAAVIWKKAKLAAGQHEHTDVKASRIERAIAEDEAFLAAHPARRNNSEATARRREFKEAMRRRIREIAASRDLSDEEIKPALTLKHHEIGRFSQQHGVNLAWLLEGKGRIFEKDPITINSNMTGSEFAAVVTTLPMADQQAIHNHGP
jgi:hypothetical protein